MKPCSNRPGKSWQRLYGTLVMNNARLPILYVILGNPVKLGGRHRRACAPYHISQGHEGYATLTTSCRDFSLGGGTAAFGFHSVVGCADRIKCKPPWASGFLTHSLFLGAHCWEPMATLPTLKKNYSCDHPRRVLPQLTGLTPAWTEDLGLIGPLRWRTTPGLLVAFRCFSSPLMPNVDRSWRVPRPFNLYERSQPGPHLKSLR